MRLLGTAERQYDSIGQLKNTYIVMTSVGPLMEMEEELLIAKSPHDIIAFDIGFKSSVLHVSPEKISCVEL